MMQYPIIVKINGMVARYEEIMSYGKRVGSLFICNEDYSVCSLFSVPLGPNPQKSAWARDDKWVAKIAAEKIKELVK